MTKERSKKLSVFLRYTNLKELLHVSGDRTLKFDSTVMILFYYADL